MSKLRNNFDYDKKKLNIISSTSNQKPKNSSNKSIDNHKALKTNVQGDPIEQKIIEEPEIENNISISEENKLLITEVKNPIVIAPSLVIEQTETKEELLPSERENYLQKKLEEMNIDDTLQKGISQGIDIKNNELYEDFQSDRLKISEKPINFSDNIEKNNKQLNETTSNETMKLIGKLKKDEDNIRSKLAKLGHNQKVIENESSIGTRNSIIEENIRNKRIKTIKRQKEDLLARMDAIERQINDIVSSEDKKSKKEAISEFLENFEKDKLEIEEKVQKFKEQSLKQREKMKNDLDLAREKRQKELERVDMENEKRKQKILKDLREKEMQIVSKRKKEIDEKMEKTKKFIDEKVQKKEKEYLYYKNQERFINEEKKLCDKVKMQKKDKIISKEEIEELAEKLKEQREQTEKDAQEKKELMKEMWKERMQTLPEYKNPISEIAMEEEDSKAKEEERKVHAKERVEYANNSVPKPVTDVRLKQKREKQSAKTDKGAIQETEKRNKEKLNMFKQMQPKVKTKCNSLNEMKVSNSQEVINILTKKPQRIKMPERKVIQRPEKPIDYLVEMREKRTKSNSPVKKFSIEIEKGNNKTKESKGNIIENLQKMKSQNDVLNTKLEQKKELMKVNGGYAKNPELGEEIGDILVESIKAKLTLLNNLNTE